MTTSRVTHTSETPSARNTSRRQASAATHGTAETVRTNTTDTRQGDTDATGKQTAGSIEDSPATAGGPAPAQHVETPEHARARALMDAGKNVFLTGKAGTGKSTLIRSYLTQTHRNSLVVAPTGIAALNVGGYTIHRIFSFDPKQSPAVQAKSPRYRPKRFARLLQEIDTLVIDEASMVRADMFDGIATALRRFGPKTGEPFGGVQIILVGDLFQLPPVVIGAEKTMIDQAYESPYFFSAAAYDPSAFTTVQLQTVFRQKDGDGLVDALNEIREGHLSDQSMHLLGTRVDPGFTPPVGEMWLTLTATNRVADARNEHMMNTLDADPVTLRAASQGQLAGFTKPVPELLTLKEGAQVMMLTNDPDDRWVNGTIGTISEIRRDDFDEDIVIRVNTQDGAFTVEPHTWEVTNPVTITGNDGKKTIEHEVVGSYTQMPMKPAWAVTIHKSQGQTLDHVIIDLAGGAFADGQVYVALSRATSLAGMVLRSAISRADVRADPRVAAFLSRGTPVVGAPLALINAVTVPCDPPRIAQLTVTTEYGTWSTLVRPETDLRGVHLASNPIVADLAPTLDEAWQALTPMLAGRALAGRDATRLLAIMRGQAVSPATRLPSGALDLEDLPEITATDHLVSKQAAAQWKRAPDRSPEPLPVVEAPARPGGYLLRSGWSWPSALTGPDARAAAVALAAARARLAPSSTLDFLIERAEEHLGVGIGAE